MPPSPGPIVSLNLAVAINPLVTVEFFLPPPNLTLVPAVMQPLRTPALPTTHHTVAGASKSPFCYDAGDVAGATDGAAAGDYAAVIPAGDGQPSCWRGPPDDELL